MGVWEEIDRGGDFDTPNITMHVMSVSNLSQMLLLPDGTECIIVQTLPFSSGITVESLFVGEKFRETTRAYMADQGDSRHPIAFIIYRLPDGGIFPDTPPDLPTTDNNTPKGD